MSPSLFQALSFCLRARVRGGALALALAGAMMAAGCGSDSSGCSDDYDCAGAQFCVDGTCVPSVCKGASDCIAPGMTCVQNRCVSSSGADATPSGSGD